MGLLRPRILQPGNRSNGRGEPGKDIQAETVVGHVRPGLVLANVDRAQDTSRTPAQAWKIQVKAKKTNTHRRLCMRSATSGCYRARKRRYWVGCKAGSNEAHDSCSKGEKERKGEADEGEGEGSSSLWPAGPEARRFVLALS